MKNVFYSYPVLLMILFNSWSNFAAAQNVNIPDANLEKAVRDTLRKGSGAITAADMKQLTDLHIGDRNIISLTGIEQAVNLKNLGLWDNKIRDMSPLANLKNLTWLHLGSNPISDIEPLSGLKNLTWLGMWNNKISDVSHLKSLSNLTHLDLSTNAISDVSPLSGLKALKKLRLQWNSVNDVRPLANLRNLEVLDLRGNQIRTVRSLESLKIDRLLLGSNPITVNVPLTLTESMTLARGQFAVFSRDRDRSIARKVSIIYQDWDAFIKANPVITKSSKAGNNQDGFGGLLERVNETLDSFRTEGFGGTIELIVHPNTKLKFGDLVISEIMWGRHGTPADNQWFEFYSPRKRITLKTNQYALLFTGEYLDRKVIPKTEPYSGWQVIDRVRNASTRRNVSWDLPGLSSGTLRDQPPVSMRREIDYETRNVLDGSLENSWTASSGRVNLQPPSHGSPGDEGGVRVLIGATNRPPMYWVASMSGRLQRLAGKKVETLVPSVENIISVAVDAANGLTLRLTLPAKNCIGQIRWGEYGMLILTESR